MVDCTIVQSIRINAHCVLQMTAYYYDFIIILIIIII